MSLREGFPKKVAVLLSKFLSTFRCILGQFGDGDGEGETPAQIFWHIGVQKKWYKLSKGGGGGEFGQNPKEQQLFFRESISKCNL